MEGDAAEADRDHRGVRQLEAKLGRAIQPEAERAGRRSRAPPPLSRARRRARFARATATAPPPAHRILDDSKLQIKQI